MKKINRIMYVCSIIVTILLTSVSIFTVRANDQVSLKNTKENGILAWKHRPSKSKQYIKLSDKQTPLPESIKNSELFKFRSDEEDDEVEIYKFSEEDFSDEVLKGYDTMFPALAEETSIRDLIKVFVGVAAQESPEQNFKPLSWCFCKPIGLRIMLTLSFLNDIVSQHSDKDERLVHADLSEELGLQSYLLMLGLLTLNYSNIHFNFVNIQDISGTVNVFGEKLQKRIKVDDDAIVFDSDSKAQQSSFKIHTDDIEIVVTGYGQGLSKYLNDIKQEKAIASHSFALVDPYPLALAYGFNRDNLQKYLSPNPEELTDKYYEKIKEKELEEVMSVKLVLYDDEGKRDLVVRINPKNRDLDDKGKEIGLYIELEGGESALTTENKTEIYETIKEVCQDWYDKGEERKEDELLGDLLKVAKKYKMHIFPFQYMEEKLYREAFEGKTLDNNLDEAKKIINSIQRNDAELTTLNELYFISNDASYVISLFMPSERKPWVELDGKDTNDLVSALNDQIGDWWEKEKITSKKDFIANVINSVENTKNTRIFANIDSRDLYDIDKNHKQAQIIFDEIRDKDSDFDDFNGLVFKSSKDPSFVANIFFDLDSSLYYDDPDSEAALFALEIDDMVLQWKNDKSSISKKELVLDIFKKIKARKDMLFLNLGLKQVDEGQEVEYSMMSSISHYDAFDELIRKTHADKTPIIYILDKWYPNLPGKYDLVGGN